METQTNYPRSIGELIRGQKEAVHQFREENLFESIQVTNTLTLTCIETYFKGMVGETICAYSYYATDFSTAVPTITSVDIEEDLRAIYNITTGRRNRFKIWYFLKNFNGWSESVIPYIE